MTKQQDLLKNILLPILSIVYYYFLWYIVGDFEQAVETNQWIAILFLIIFLAELWAMPYQSMAENYILGKSFSIAGIVGLLWLFRLGVNIGIWAILVRALIGRPPMIFLAFILLKEISQLILAHRKLKQAPSVPLKMLADFIVFNTLSISTFIIAQMFVNNQSLKIKWGSGWEGALVAIVFFIIFYCAIQLYHIYFQWQKSPKERPLQVLSIILSAVFVVIPVWF